MPDDMTPEQRHKTMSRIRSTNTKPEMIVRRYLHACGLRYRLHVVTLPGKPDIVLPRYGTCVLVNGCFWHGHEGCKYFRLPLSNQDYWSSKIERNIARDRESQARLEVMGWRVIVVWECELKADAEGRCGRLTGEICG